MKARILLAEDDPSLGFIIKDTLAQQGYEVSLFADGQAAAARFPGSEFDLCILDVMLPGLSGFDLARHIRSSNTSIPIIFLTARSLQEDKLYGLRLGADDYLSKPFSIEELLLKISIFLKRSQAAPASTPPHSLGTYKFDEKNRLLTHPQSSGRQLTSREADLLLLLMQHPNQLLERERILNKIWGTDDYFAGRSLDVFISRLRKYLQADAGLEIQNVHGMGFKLRVP